MSAAAYAIALNTFKEAVRDRILAVCFVFALLLMASSTVLSWLTVGSELKIVTDIGLAAEAFFAALIAVLVGINLVHKEVDKRTIYAVLAKPVPRWLFIVGKYLGLMAVLVVAIGLMSVFYVALVWWKGGIFPVHVLGALVLSVFEVSVVTAVAIVFSSFAPPIEAAILTAGVWAIGHMSWGFAALAARIPSESVGYVITALYHLVPDLETFNIRAQVVHELPVATSYYFAAVAYALAYTAAMLALAVLIFRRRDLK
ncbi:MAG: ABC transporter permease [Acidobacteriota bacterium]|jgi:ABC-type transport system involved in multi-copper enzyme maturation permease subunit